MEKNQIEYIANLETSDFLYDYYAKQYFLNLDKPRSWKALFWI